MEKVKQALSDVVHHWAFIVVGIMFLFSVNPGPTETKALEHQVQTEVQDALKTKKLKKATLEQYSNAVYKPSEMLSDKELKNLLKSIGFEGKALKLAWAVAKSESNGRPMAYNGNRKTGDSSYGIFQINMLGDLGDDRKEKFNLRSNVLLFDPVINAEITYYMTKGGTDWSSWKGITPSAKKWLEKFPS